MGDDEAPAGLTVGTRADPLDAAALAVLARLVTADELGAVLVGWWTCCWPGQRGDRVTVRAGINSRRAGTGTRPPPCSWLHPTRSTTGRRPGGHRVPSTAWPTCSLPPLVSAWPDGARHRSPGCSLDVHRETVGAAL